MDELLKNLPQIDPLELLEDNNPREEDTVGELVSKLSYATMQMWNNQEILYKIRSMQPDTFSTMYGNNMPELHRIIKRACDLNIQRSRIVDAIDLKILQIRGEKY